ncbi:c-type cytochrome biogenesis protein CcmI [Polycladidibacter hongkongensis]|uniref:c-type cytochrome biogenesis protein CcmI n=1 Tax=Polycladidibacter hongkongensis TaxID=1647556 RepID=UPI00082DAF48|nr:c-type cytochrome biogenesis protein CcmI [Pseudovibrio hongkongensis]
MTFWIFVALLTLALALAILLPLRARRLPNAPEQDGDVAVFKDQLRSLLKDRDSGAIEPEAAKALEVEISRRLLAASRASKTPVKSPAHWGTRIAAGFAIVALPAMALGLYMHFGAPGVPDQPLEARLANARQNVDLNVMVARTQDHLRQNPDDLRGWQVLGPILMRMGEFDQAVTAYGHIARLSGRNVQTLTNLAEALIFRADGQVDETAKGLLLEALQDDPQAIKTRYYLALGESQSGDPQVARTAWQQLIAEAPADAPWLPAAKNQLARLSSKNEKPAKSEPQTPAGSTADAEKTAEHSSMPEGELAGPSPEDMRAASELSAEDRADMVSGMVDRLRARLFAEGGSLQQWQMLLRSYSVTGNKEAAHAALQKAKEQLGEKSADYLALEQAAAQLGLTPP